MRRFGIISDTHGLLRPEVVQKLEGCEKILHAGDVGTAAILDELRAVAPLVAVRGNVDHGETGELPSVAQGDLGGVPFFMTHQRADVEKSWRRQAEIVVFGHSHRPELEWHGKCLDLNPGAVGPRRFSLPLTMALIHVSESRWFPEILSIEV